MPQAQNTRAAEKGWAFLILGPHTPVGWGLVFAVSTRPCVSLSSPPAQVAVKDIPETSCSPGPNTLSWCPPVPPTPAGASLWVADSPPDTREAGAVSPRAQCPAPAQGLAHAQEDLRGMGGRPWASQESEDLSGRRHHLVLSPVSLPQRREFCSHRDSPAKQKGQKPVGQLCGFLKQVRREWPRLGRLPSNLGQKGFLFVLEKAESHLPKPCSPSLCPLPSHPALCPAPPPRPHWFP